MNIKDKVQEAELSLLKAFKMLREIKTEIEGTISKEFITKEEYNGLMWELDGWPDIVKAIHNNYSITSIDQLERKELPIVKSKIKEIKKTFENYVEK